jgi:hypothetical protein
LPCYYHEDRTHLGLDKETPVGRIHSCASPKLCSALESRTYSRLFFFSSLLYLDHIYHHPAASGESCRWDLLNHAIALNERHLKRLLSDYIRYYHEDRTHLGFLRGESIAMV